MKWSVLIGLIFCITINSFGQRPGEIYAFTTDSRVYLWNDKTQSPVNDNTVYYRALRGNVFVIREKVAYRSDDTVIVGYRIAFWKFVNNKINPPADTLGIKIILVRDGDTSLPYFISDADLAAKATTEFRKPSGFFAVNALVLPIKLRFKNKQPGGIFDFTQSISLGPVVSKTWYRGGAFSNNSFSILFGVNITNVPVDEQTLPGVIESKTTLFGLSPVVGGSFEIGGITFGALTGIDILTGDAGRVWSYRKSPWFGFSIGTPLFTTAPEIPTQ